MLRLRQSLQQVVLSHAAQQNLPFWRQTVQVHALRQTVQRRRAVPGAPRQARRRQAAQVRSLPQAVQSQDRLKASHVSTYRAEAVRVRHLPQGFHPQGSHAQALRDALEEAARQGSGASCPGTRLTLHTTTTGKQKHI